MLAANTTTVTIGFLPIGLATVPIRDLQFYWVNLLILAEIPTLLTVLLHVVTRGFDLR